MIAKTAHIITHDNANAIKQTVIPTRDELSQQEFNDIMKQGLQEAKNNRSQHLKEAFATVRKSIKK